MLSQSEDAGSKPSRLFDVSANAVDEAIRAIPAHQLRAADHDLPQMDPEVSIDPYRHFGALRDRLGDVVPYVDGAYGGVRVFNAFGHDLSRPNFCVLGYDTIRKMVFDKVNFINSGSYGLHTEVQKTDTVTTVNELDGDEHRLTRKLFDLEVFSRDTLTQLAEETIAPIAAFLTGRIRAMLDRGETVDLSRHFALPLLFMSMARITGAPLDRIGHFVELAERAFGGPRDLAAAARAVEDLNIFFSDRLAARRRSGDLNGSDLMSLMSRAERDGRRFSDEEIVVYCRFLLPGGIETTWRQTANMCLALMSHPDQYDQVVADPGLIDQTVEECCRWLPSGATLPRIAAHDVELAGVRVPAGSSMVGLFGIANRDPRIWSDPDRFDIHRQRLTHLTFSMGSHGCMGQHLARQNLRNALAALIRDLPDIELACDPGELRTTGYVIRCPDAVPVRRRTT